MSLIKGLIPGFIALLFLSIIFGVMDIFFLDYAIYGDGSEPPIEIGLQDKILFYLGLYPLIFYFLIYTCYKSVFRYTNRQIVIMFVPIVVLLEIYILFYIYIKTV